MNNQTVKILIDCTINVQSLQMISLQYKIKPLQDFKIINIMMFITKIFKGISKIAIIKTKLNI